MKKIKYTKELLEPLVKESKSVADVIRKLGLVDKGGNFKTIGQHLINFKLDMSHFTGQGWSKGLTYETSESVRKKIDKQRTLKLIKNIRIRSESLHRLVKETGKKYQCEECNNNGIWNNKFLKLHIDHKDGDNMNNEITNLRYLCPNCHSQTDTYCSKNKREWYPRSDSN